MKTVFIAGATGYLGRHLVAHYVRQGWHVRALVRDATRASDLTAQEVIEAQATQAKTLCGVMGGAGLVISALGITHQKDGLSYFDVDYQANANLLKHVLRAGVPRFAYIHVLNADLLPDVLFVTAKEVFANLLRTAPIASTIIAPSGFFGYGGHLYCHQPRSRPSGCLRARGVPLQRAGGTGLDSLRTSAGATHLPDAETPCVFCLGWPHAAFTALRSFL